MINRRIPTPLISIVVPTHNRARLLRDAVESVLAQTYQHWELLVVDDGSTDATRAYLSTLTDDRIRAVLLDHSGNAAQVRNRGAQAARGSYVAFLDSDDLWDPEKLALQIEDLVAHPECRWSYTAARVVDERGREIRPARPQRSPPQRGWILERVVEGRATVATSTVVVERELLESVGGFDESLPRSHDIDLWIRLAETSQATCVATPVVTWRRHSGNRLAVSLAMFGYRDRIYERLQARTSSSRVRTLCHRQRIRVSLEFVDRFRQAGRYDDARQALRLSFPYAGAHPRWWIALLKTWLRPAIPGAALSIYSRLRWGRAPGSR